MRKGTQPVPVVVNGAAKKKSGTSRPLVKAVLMATGAATEAVAVAEAPAEQLLVETDAPFLAPEPHRGRTNEPVYTADTARSLAATGVALEMSQEEGGDPVEYVNQAFDFFESRFSDS